MRSVAEHTCGRTCARSTCCAFSVISADHGASLALTAILSVNALSKSFSYDLFQLTPNLSEWVLKVPGGVRNGGPVA